MTPVTESALFLPKIVAGYSAQGKPSVTAGRKAKGSRLYEIARLPEGVVRRLLSEKVFASLTSGSRAHGVWQAISPLGNQGVLLSWSISLAASTPLQEGAKTQQTQQWSVGPS